MAVSEEWNKGYTEGWNDCLDSLKCFIKEKNSDKDKIIEKINEMFVDP